MYPLLEINLDKIKENSASMNKKLNSMGLRVCGVIKVSDGDCNVAEAYRTGGCDQIGSSRIIHLKDIKERFPETQTLLVRIPMECEIEDVVAYADISLNSEEKTLRLLSCEAVNQCRQHSVIIMLDCGDRREGVTNYNDLISLCVLSEELPGIKLLGIGTNWGCVGGVFPDKEKLNYFAEVCEHVEKALGHKLEIISGGNSAVLPWIYEGKKLPPQINHLRIGGTIADPITIKLNRNLDLDGASYDTFCLKAQISEIKIKPSGIKSETSENWNGAAVVFEDKGLRKRAIINVGGADIGECSNLIPLDSQIEIIACSSDHTVIDITDCDCIYRVGDVVPFYMKYSALLYAFGSRHVNRSYK